MIDTKCIYCDRPISHHLSDGHIDYGGTDECVALAMGFTVCGGVSWLHPGGEPIEDLPWFSTYDGLSVYEYMIDDLGVDTCLLAHTKESGFYCATVRIEDLYVTGVAREASLALCRALLELKAQETT